MISNTKNLHSWFLNCPVLLKNNYSYLTSNPYDHKVDNLADNVIFRLPTKIRTTKIGIFHEVYFHKQKFNN